MASDGMREFAVNIGPRDQRAAAPPPSIAFGGVTPSPIRRMDSE